MKKYFLFCLFLLLMQPAFSMEHQSPATMVLHDNNLLNLIVQQLCIVNQYNLKNLHHSLRNLRLTNQHLSKYRIPDGCGAHIIGLLNKDSYYSPLHIASQLKFSPEITLQLQNFKSLALSHTLSTSFQPDFSVYNPIYYPSLLSITLYCSHIGTAKKLFNLPTMKFFECRQAYCCTRSGSCALTTCPLTLAIESLLYKNLSNQDKESLYDIIKSLLKTHKMDPRAHFIDTLSLLECSRVNDNEKLTTLLTNYGTKILGSDS